MAILPHPGCDLSDNVVDQVGIATIETTFNEDGQIRCWLAEGRGPRRDRRSLDRWPSRSRRLRPLMTPIDHLRRRFILG